MPDVKKGGVKKNPKILFFPSKHLELGQTADNKTGGSGNNYHPLRFDSHFCMQLENIHGMKINLESGGGGGLKLHCISVWQELQS